MSTSNSNELFPETLNLEDQFFQEGYTLGITDGQKSGRIEGRIFGLEKGFSKAIEMGKFNGKGCVWEARMRPSTGDERRGVTPLVGNERLRRHVQRLVALSDTEGLSLENGEEEVSLFDDRLRDARGKVVIVERITGEGGTGVEDEVVGEATAATSTQQRKVPVRVRGGEKAGGGGVAGKGTGEMEDFVGRRGLGGS